MNYCFDIDGTICTNTNGEYEKAQPLTNRIKIINNLFDKGHQIIMFTARGSTTNFDWTDLTKQQLKEWGVNYHKLIFGKPDADIFVDDKAISDKLFLKSYENRFYARKVGQAFAHYNTRISFIRMGKRISSC